MSRQNREGFQGSDRLQETPWQWACSIPHVSKHRVNNTISVPGVNSGLRGTVAGQGSPVGWDRCASGWGGCCGVGKYMHNACLPP